MKVDDFLIDYFNDKDKVTVSALELQSLIIKSRQFEMQLSKALDREQSKDKTISYLKNKLAIKELEIPLHVDLRA